jgi:hypothetical protein
MSLVVPVVNRTVDARGAEIVTAPFDGLRTAGGERLLACDGPKGFHADDFSQFQLLTGFKRVFAVVMLGT